MLRSYFLSTLAVCAAGLVSTSTASAQTKVGVINFQRGLIETGEVKKAAADLPKKYQKQQDSIDKLQRDLSDIQTQLQTSAGKLSPSGQAELEAQGTRKQRELQRLTDDLNADVEKDRTDILSRAQTRMLEIVKKIAEDKGLDLVVDSSSTPFFKPALEITTDAIAAYDKAYPVK